MHRTFRQLASRDDLFFTSFDRTQPPAADLTLTNEQRGATCMSKYRDFIDYLVVGA